MNERFEMLKFFVQAKYEASRVGHFALAATYKELEEIVLKQLKEMLC